MKATAFHVEPTVNVEMTLREAQVLKALVGGIEYVSTGIVSQSMRDLFHALQEAGVAGDETFSDLFAGKVTTKPVIQRKP